MKVDLDKLDKIAAEAEAKMQFWRTRILRDFDYVSFGPVENMKDNNEGVKELYLFVATMSPSVVRQLIALARKK